MIIKHWSFPLGNNESSTKDELTVDIYVDFVIAVLTNILKLTYLYFTLDRSALSRSCKAEIKLNNERLDFRTIKIKKRRGGT